MSPINMTIYSDYICPFCFLANEVVKRIKQTQKYEFNIEWRPFELHPIRSEMPDINSDYIKMAWLNVQRLAYENAIEIKLPSYLSISRRALETAEFAREQGKFDSCHDLIFRAYFLEGKDIEKEETLLNIIQKLNLKPDALREGWKSGTYWEVIKESIRELHSLGSTAVPTFLIGNEEPRILVGLHPQATIEKVILKAQDDITQENRQ
jgi:predicted DsbA family dithiol-disulfide isomerase